MPFDHADLYEGAGLVGTDEHRRRVVLHEVTDGEVADLSAAAGIVPDDLDIGPLFP